MLAIFHKQICDVFIDKGIRDREQMLRDGVKLVFIINSCVTPKQLEMADEIFNRYVSKWRNVVDGVPTRTISIAWQRKYDQLHNIYSSNVDDGTEHF